MFINYPDTFTINLIKAIHFQYFFRPDRWFTCRFCLRPVFNLSRRNLLCCLLFRGLRTWCSDTLSTALFFQLINKRTAVDSCHAALLNTIHNLCQLKLKKTLVQFRKRAIIIMYVAYSLSVHFFEGNAVIMNRFIPTQLLYLVTVVK